MNMIILILVLLFAYTVKCQGLTKNSKDNGTILFKSNSLALDVSEAELSLGFTNLNKIIGLTNELFYSINLKAKNKSGLGGIFNKGDLQASANFNTYLGWTVSNAVPKAYLDELDNRLIKDEQYQNLLIEEYQSNLTQIFNDYLEHKEIQFRIDVKEYIESLNMEESITDKLVNIVDNTADNLQIEVKLEKVLKENNVKQPTIKKIKDKIKMLRSVHDENSVRESHDNKLAAISLFIHNQKYTQFYPFIMGGVNADEFKLYKGLNSVTLKESFKKESFRGGEFGVGFNFNSGIFMLGTTYKYKETNNFSKLTKKEYTLRNVDTLSTQSLISEEKITAYSGDYTERIVNQLDIDLVFNVKLDSNSLLINPYLKNEITRNKDLIPSTYDVGIGFYFFKPDNKFFAGLYIELNDVENRVEKSKPLDEQSIRTPLKRLNFGITTKFSLDSFLNLF